MEDDQDFQDRLTEVGNLIYAIHLGLDTDPRWRQRLEALYPPGDDHPWLREDYQIGMTGLQILVIVGHLILALRHPDNTGPSSVVARHIARQLCALICSHVPPNVLAEWQKDLDFSTSKGSSFVQKDLA